MDLCWVDSWIVSDCEVLFFLIMLVEMECNLCCVLVLCYVCVEVSKEL